MNKVKWHPKQRKVTMQAVRVLSSYIYITPVMLADQPKERV